MTVEAGPGDHVAGPGECDVDRTGDVTGAEWTNYGTPDLAKIIGDAANR